MLVLLIAVVGNSATASKLATTRNIKISGAVSGNVNFDGSSNVEIETEQSNIAVLSGTMTLTANTQEKANEDMVTWTEKTINYPSGFTKENSVVISVGVQVNTNFGYTYGWTNYMDGLDVVLGLNPARITLYGESTTSYANKIRLQIGNKTTSSGTVDYKVILMKVS